MLDWTAILKGLEGLCRDVGAYQCANFRKQSLAVNTKGHVANLVTEVDEGSEQRIFAYLEKHFPDHAILSEETGAAGAKNSDYLWVVDPLDGTNNFAQGLPVFAISIALRWRDQAQLGLVYLPYLDEMYTAIKGQGAFANGQRLAVAKKENLAECVLATGFPYDKDTHPLNNVAYAAALIPRLRGIRRMGAAAYDLCCVAAGYFDGYWELNLSPWDVAAGELIVQEAGGVIVPFRKDRGISLIAGNHSIASQIHREILACHL